MILTVKKGEHKACHDSECDLSEKEIWATVNCRRVRTHPAVAGVKIGVGSEPKMRFGRQVCSDPGFWPLANRFVPGIRFGSDYVPWLYSEVRLPICTGTLPRGRFSWKVGLWKRKGTSSEDSSSIILVGRLSGLSKDNGRTDLSPVLYSFLTEPQNPA